MTDLVEIKNNEAVCTSLDVAEKFNKRHDNILRDIFNLLKNEGVKNMFQKSSYRDKKNETRSMYYMNRDGFSLLVMGFTGEKALEWKLGYIKAFNKMESIITERKTVEWQQARLKGKQTRRLETDAIKQLVALAEEQGSKNAKMYYIAYSKLANKICGIKDREKATRTQLIWLQAVENLIDKTVTEGVAHNNDYKTIYSICKDRLMQLQQIAAL